jgi:hypothetical protein
MGFCLVADTEQTIGTRMWMGITKSVTARGVGNEKKPKLVRRMSLDLICLLGDYPEQLLPPSSIMQSINGLGF